MAGFVCSISFRKVKSVGVGGIEEWSGLSETVLSCHNAWPHTGWKFQFS